MKPLVVVNFKAYKEGFTEEGFKLIDLLSPYENVIMAVPAPLIGIAAGHYIKDGVCARQAKVFAEHVDSTEPGAHTGVVTVEEIKVAGASGSLLNHSEHRLPFDEIKKTIKRLKDARLQVILCCQSPEEAVKFRDLKPDYLAYEPPELIGGNVSVTSSKPEIIKKIVNAVRPVRVLVGAGVKTREDIIKSMELGAVGVLIASGLIKAENKEEKVRELVEFEDS